MDYKDKTILSLTIILCLIGCLVVGEKFKELKLNRKFQIEAYKEHIELLQKKLYECQREHNRL